MGEPSLITAAAARRTRALKAVDATYGKAVVLAVEVRILATAAARARDKAAMEPTKPLRDEYRRAVEAARVAMESTKPLRDEYRRAVEAANNAYVDGVRALVTRK